MKLEHWNPQHDGPFSENAMRRKLEGLGYSVSSHTYAAGTRFGEHTHAVDKIDGVVSGRFHIEMEGDAVVLRAGDLIWVPKGTRHAAEVIGDEAVRSLDAVKL